MSLELETMKDYSIQYDRLKEENR